MGLGFRAVAGPGVAGRGLTEGHRGALLIRIKFFFPIIPQL